MNKVDCVIVGHNTGSFQDFIAGRKFMSQWNGAYRDAQINSLLLNGRRISYMDFSTRPGNKWIPPRHR